MGAFESLLMFLGSSVCHQLPERSYFQDGIQMPLCARCIGIHFGFILSTLFLLTGTRRFASGFPSVRQLAVLGGIMSLFLVDAGLSYSGISPSDNLRRTLSGLALGVPFPFFLFSVLNNAMYPGRNPIVVLARPANWGWLAGLYALGAVAILLASRSLPLFCAVSTIGVIGVFVFFSVAFSLILALAIENRHMSSSRVLLDATMLAVSVLIVLAVVHSTLFPGI